MNLSAHIITCSPLVMNLPAHDTNKHLLVQVSQHNIQNKSKKSYCLQRYRLALPRRRQVILLHKPPSGTLSLPGTKMHLGHCPRGYRLAGFTSLLGATHYSYIPTSHIAWQTLVCLISDTLPHHTLFNYQYAHSQLHLYKTYDSPPSSLS